MDEIILKIELTMRPATYSAPWERRDFTHTELRVTTSRKRYKVESQLPNDWMVSRLDYLFDLLKAQVREEVEKGRQKA